MMGYFGDKWDKRFLLLACHISKWSKDPSTKVGAVLVRPDKSVASVGFNGFPPGIKDTYERLQDRSQKYRLIRHAEVNCIDFCRDEDKSQYILFLWTPNLVPCTSCAAHVIANKIGAVAYPCRSKNTDFTIRWQEDNNLASEMLREAGVGVFPIQLD